LTKRYVGAHFLYEGEVIKVWKAEIMGDVPQNIEPGNIVDVAEEGGYCEVW